jgi:hypothetical protein
MGYLESPVPILVGITIDDYFDLNMTSEEKDMKNWIIMDKNDNQIIRDRN